jgi:hypothetical protein
MRHLFAPAVTAAATLSATLLAILALAGCAVIVVPDDGNGSVHFASAFSGSAVEGNGQSQLETRAVSSVGKLDINGPVRVEVRVGPAPSLQVEAESNLLPLVHTEVSGDTLRISVQGSFHSNSGLRVIYTTPQLTQINASGSGRLLVSGLNGDALYIDQNGSRSTELRGNVGRLDLQARGSGSIDSSGLNSGATQVALTGSGRLDLGRIHGDTLDVKVEGSGGVRGSGEVRALNVRVRGSGSVDLAALRSENADLSGTGSGDISAAVTQKVVAEASGSGRIIVHGNPLQVSVKGNHVTVGI